MNVRTICFVHYRKEGVSIIQRSSLAIPQNMTLIRHFSSKGPSLGGGGGGVSLIEEVHVIY